MRHTAGWHRVFTPRAGFKRVAAFRAFLHCRRRRQQRRPDAHSPLHRAALLAAHRRPACAGGRGRRRHGDSGACRRALRRRLARGHRSSPRRRRRPGSGRAGRCWSRPCRRRLLRAGGTRRRGRPTRRVSEHAGPGFRHRCRCRWPQYRQPAVAGASDAMSSPNSACRSPSSSTLPPAGAETAKPCPCAAPAISAAASTARSANSSSGCSSRRTPMPWSTAATCLHITAPSGQLHAISISSGAGKSPVPGWQTRTIHRRRQPPLEQLDQRVDRAGAVGADRLPARRRGRP